MFEPYASLFSKKLLLPIILILLAGLVLRAHHITALPVFTDETLHIERASHIYDFRQHPAEEGTGKFLFYFLPGIFDLTHGETALFLGRTIVALTSLITGAVVYRSGTMLFDVEAGFIGLVFYMLVPFAVFFERMALADPFAGLMAALLVWHSLRFARYPTNRRALWVGLFVALTPAAKLSMAFVGFVPVITVVLFAEYESLSEMLRRYFPYGLRAAVVVIGLWSLVLIPAAIASYYTPGQKYIFFPNFLVDTTTESQTFLQKLSDLWQKLDLLVWSPLVIVGILLLPKVMHSLPRRAGFIMVWLLLAWIPAFFIVGTNSFQSRYLMSGVPAIAVLVGAVFTVGLDFIAVLIRQMLVVLLFGFWIVLFALPFARDAAAEPELLDLPPLDEKDYFAGYYNAYGLYEALDYLRENGISQGQQVYVIQGTRFCLPDYYGFAAHMDMLCEKRFYRGDVDLKPLINDDAVFYLITDAPPLDLAVSGFHVNQVAVFNKPSGDIQITIWRLSVAD